jgi:hypothetical protein
MNIWRRIRSYIRSRRIRQAKKFWDRYELRRPRSKLALHLWETRANLWTIEMDYWSGRKAEAKITLEVFMKQGREDLWLYRFELKEMIRNYIWVWKSDLKRITRPKNIKKWLYRRIMRMPEVFTASTKSTTAVVLKKDWKNAKRVMFDYGKPPKVNDNWGLPFVPRRTMVFIKNPERRNMQGIPTEEVITGTKGDMHELLRGCVVHPLGRETFFVPFAKHHHLRDWQIKQFPQVTLEEAYRLIWGKRRKAPDAH